MYTCGVGSCVCAAILSASCMLKLQQYPGKRVGLKAQPCRLWSSAVLDPNNSGLSGTFGGGGGAALHVALPPKFSSSG